MTIDPPAEEHLELAGGRVHLLRSGAGEPLLFLHAIGGAGAWLDFHRLLAGSFDLIAPDHPGFGGSDDFPDVTAMDDLVFHYLDVMDALGLHRPHVIGASFGGWIAAELAVTAPHRIASLVLLSPAGLRVPGHPVPDIFLMSADQLAATLFQNPPPSPQPDPRPADTPGPPDIDAILAAYRDQAALARFCWSPYLCNPKLDRRLHRITVPTLSSRRRRTGSSPSRTASGMPSASPARVFLRSGTAGTRCTSSGQRSSLPSRSTSWPRMRWGTE